MNHILRRELFATPSPKPSSPMLSSIDTLKPNDASGNTAQGEDESHPASSPEMSAISITETQPTYNGQSLGIVSRRSTRFSYDADDEESGYINYFRGSDGISELEEADYSLTGYASYEAENVGDDFSDMRNEGDELISENESATDPFGVIQLTEDFEYLLDRISIKVKELCQRSEESTISTLKYYEDNELKAADEEIARLNYIIKECDEIEKEFIQAAVIGEIVKDFKGRIIQLEEQLAGL